MSHLTELQRYKIQALLEQKSTIKTIAEYLETTDYNPLRIAVEKNGEIVPKTTYTETVLQDGDSIEIVNFVGGG